jgi:N utilization substance protein B
MQALYALETMFPQLSEEQEQQEVISRSELVSKGIKILHEKIKNSDDLFLLMLAYMSRIAQFAEADARNRAAKYLPSEADRHVDIKISGNTFLWDLLEHATFQEKCKSAKMDIAVDAEWVKKLYQKLIQSDPYNDYIKTASREPDSEKKIMQYIWKSVMMGNENFVEYLSDEWSAWEDDQGMMYMLMENYFKNPQHVNFLRFISPDKMEYAQSLLETVIEKNAYALENIKPKLKNWDAERVAIIDLVLLKMGFCELLYFPTIPTKVTINEFIEIAKQYSTLQSGQFVNGVLDNLLKDLTKENKIRKVERSK